ncbi:ATP-binding protein [Actinoplanes sp. NPDC023714]|uniref:ATP-binding protein n=1 Tax=Actinoplanes sp. NPDC023714 TaxID=3154322 RepID=UPI0033F59D71
MSNPAVMPYGEAGDLPSVRAFVREQAEASGLDPGSIEALAIAVSELVTNTLQHTTGGGQVRVWAEHAAVFCDVADGGAVPSFPRAMPAPDAERGRGLAIVEMLCDDVTTIAEPGRTVVRLRFATKPRH